MRTLGRLAGLVGVALLILVVNVGLSIVAGMPLMFLAGRWVAG